MIFFCNKCGQLGNRLFAFAHLIANAKEYNYEVVNMSFDEYARYFDSTHRDVFCRYPLRTSFVKNDKLRSICFAMNKGVLKVLRGMKFFSSRVHSILIADLPEYKFTDDRYFDLNSSSFVNSEARKPVVLLFGRFFRDYDNFEKHQHEIRSFFKPSRAIMESVSKVMQEARSKADIVVGVHIRRGDYAEFANGKYFFSQNDYGRKIGELKESHPGKRISFVVCSNEPVQGDAFGSGVTKGPGHLVGDMYALSECDYILGPPSTYTLWASFYGKRPLYQIRDIDKSISFDDFKLLPKEILYNFSFN